MNTLDCIRERRSIRQFSSQKIDPDTLKTIVGASAFVPSWKNTQVTRYIAVENKDLLTKIAEYTPSYNAQIILNAPLLVAVTVIKNRSGFERDGSYSTIRKDGWQMFDAGIACQTFCLSAYESGLGTVIMGIFDVGEITALLEIPKEQELIALIAAGYPDNIPATPKKKTVEDLLIYK